MIKSLSIMMCLLIASTAIASPKAATLRFGQKAPFAGVLFDPEALATIQTDKETAEKKCQLERAMAEEKCVLSKKFESDNCVLQKEIMTKQFNLQLQEKEMKIKVLNDKFSKITPQDPTFLIGIGIGIGILVGAGAAIVLERAF
jgi:hypothetical protein